MAILTTPGYSQKLMARTRKDLKKYKFRRPLIGKPEQKFKNPKLDYDRREGKLCSMCNNPLRSHGELCPEIVSDITDVVS